METTTAVSLLGCLNGALTLLKQAQTIDPDGFGPGLQSMVDELGSEITDAEECLTHAMNHRMATLLPEGFAYLPD